MTRTISITELQNSGVESWSVKDDSPRGIMTKYTSQIKPGDEVVIDNYFTTVTEATESAQREANPVDRIRAAIEAEPARSAWKRGVKVYALELLDELAEAIDGGYFDPANFETPRMLRAALLNGAADWHQYSEGGSALVYNGDIAERLCSPSELKRTRNGERTPNSRETWLDAQARALYQAADMIVSLGRA